MKERLPPIGEHPPHSMWIKPDNSGPFSEGHIPPGQGNVRLRKGSQNTRMRGSHDAKAFSVNVAKGITGEREKETGMADKLVPAFTIEDVRRWEKDIRANDPPPLTDTDITLLPGVSAMSFGLSPYGIAMRLVTDAGTNTDLFLNPVVAHALMQSIRGWGAKGGWVAPDGGLSIPQIPPSMKKDL